MNTSNESRTSTAVGDRAERWEKNVLGALLEDSKLWGQAATVLKSGMFLLEDDRKIFAAISKLHSQNQPADLVSVAAELGGTVNAAYLGSLIDGVVPSNFTSYLLHVREADQDRRFGRLVEQIARETTRHGRERLVRQMEEALSGYGADHPIFHTFEEFENAPPLRWAIDNFLQADGITFTGALAGHGKTLIMISMARALLEAVPLFGHELFSVAAPAKRVVYLTPECSIGPFGARIKLFRLQEHVQARRLLVRTLSSREQVPLDDVRLLKAVEGAHVFLDTAVRFMNGSENDAEDNRPFADTLFRLLTAGAITITAAHHAPKSFEKDERMSLQNILRGSGDIGAMLCACWGVRQVDRDINRLYVENVKPRDFGACGAFLLEGRPHLDETGQFKMVKAPGSAGELRSYLRKGDAARGRPVTPDKDEKMRRAVELRSQGVSLREISQTLVVGKSTIDRWLFDYDSAQSPPLPLDGKCPTTSSGTNGTECHAEPRQGGVS